MIDAIIDIRHFSYIVMLMIFCIRNQLCNMHYQFIADACGSIDVNDIIIIDLQVHLKSTLFAIIIWRGTPSPFATSKDND